MSDRGQKIFKIITWIVLIAIVALVVGRKAYSIVNPKLSMNDWMAMLNESFGIETEDDYGDIIVTGVVVKHFCNTVA